VSLLKARAEARAEYSIQGICTDLFYDDFVADCQCDHCKRYRADVLRREDNAMAKRQDKQTINQRREDNVMAKRKRRQTNCKSKKRRQCNG
jgi:glycyl-tRNA synthetase (class II)